MAQLTPQFFETILKIEGGFQNKSSDNGNYCEGQLIGTKYGMSAGAVGTWWGRCPSEQEMRNLTTEDAKAFYSWYFHRYNLFKIENQQFFELLANNTMGSPANATKVAQRVLNEFGYNVAVDGALGPKTISALNDAWRRHGAKVYNAIRDAWVQYLKGINRPEFIDGWMKRMDKYFPLLAVATAEISIGVVLIGAFLLYQLFKNRQDG